MAVKIRLARFGAKKKPYYRIVVSDAESPRDGRFIEQVGTYDPLLKKDSVKFNTEKVRYWLDKGAVPTQTVANFLKTLGLLSKPGGRAPENPVSGKSA